MLKDQTLEDFTAKLASSAAVPGGGGVSALTGALAAGLGVMVGCLTAGKEKYAAVEGEINALTAEAREILGAFMGIIDADAEAFEPLSRAYALPKDASGRDEIMEGCLLRAAGVPMETVRLCGRAIELAERLSQIGSALAVSDAGCAAALCRAALESAALNVFVNTRLMADRAAAKALNDEVQDILDKYIPLAGGTYEDVKRRLFER